MPLLVIFVFLYLYFVLDLYIVFTHVFSGYANFSRGKSSVGHFRVSSFPVKMNFSRC